MPTPPRFSPPCARLGLETKDRAALTGYTSKAVAALAHLREAWAGADNDNRASITKALCQLLHGHSFRENWRRVASVLIHDLSREDATDLVLDVERELEAEAAASRSVLASDYAEEWHAAYVQAGALAGVVFGVRSGGGLSGVE